MTTKNGKKLNKALMMGTALVTLGAVSTEANAAPGAGTMGAVILSPIAVAAPTDLHFGSMTDGGVGGTMLVDVAGARTPTGVVPVVGAGLESQGVLSISGATGVNIDLAMTATSFTVSNGTATMAVNNFQLVTNAGGTTEVITLAASPSSFPVGATLNVAAAQGTGTYTGTYNVTASYQ